MTIAFINQDFHFDTQDGWSLSIMDLFCCIIYFLVEALIFITKITLILEFIFAIFFVLDKISRISIESILILLFISDSIWISH